MKIIEPLNPIDLTESANSELPLAERPSQSPTTPDPIALTRQHPQTAPVYTPPALKRPKRRIAIPSLLLNMFAGLLFITAISGLVTSAGNTLLFVLNALQALMAVGLFLRWAIARYVTIILTALFLVLLLVQLSTLLAFSPQLLPFWIFNVAAYAAILVLLTLPSIKQQF